MARPIYLQLSAPDNRFRPSVLLAAMRAFWAMLQDVDAAASRDPRGTVDWKITAINTGSPLVAAFEGESVLPNVDNSAVIREQLIRGLKHLSETGERPVYYSDSTLINAKKLAAQRRYLSEVKVYSDEEQAIVQSELTARVDSLTSTRYESVGAVVGSLDSITVHNGYEFRVWNEVNGRAVRCRFPLDEELLNRVKDYLGKRVMVYGDLKANAQGEATVVQVEGFEPYSSDVELPTIEEMSGLVDDITGGLSLADYMKELRNGSTA
jgi:hypothetical protein